MSLELLREGAIIQGVLTSAGSSPEKRFRFAEPLSPYSTKHNVHISSKVIRSAGLSLTDLSPGVAVELAVTSGTDRRGEPSWTAATLRLTPSVPNHLGTVDSGGVQHLSRGDAWFLEDVIPEIKLEKVIIYTRVLTKKARSQTERMKPGSIIMFSVDDRRITAADLYDPTSLTSDLLVQGLNCLPSLHDDEIVSTVLEIFRRTDHQMLDQTWSHLSSTVCNRIIQPLLSSGELQQLGANCPDKLVKAALTQLSPSEFLVAFPSHPVAWENAEIAAILLSQKIAEGLNLSALLKLCANRGVTEQVWRSLAKSHSAWIVEQVSDPVVFESVTDLATKDSIKFMLQAFDGQDLLGKNHLIPWLPHSVLTEYLEHSFSESYVPEDELIRVLIARLEHSSIIVPMPVLSWSPVFWDSKQRSAIVKVIDYHHERLLINPEDEWSLDLIAESIGLLLHTYADEFNNPDLWDNTPSDWVGHIIDIVREFPAIDTEIQARSAFGSWDQQVGFEGPARVWLHRDDLAAGWPTFTPNDKILAIYRLLSSDIPFPREIHMDDEKHPMVRSFLTLIDGAQQDTRAETAVHAHDLITEAVLKRIPAPGSKAAVNPDELIIDYAWALPRCSVIHSKVQFCEGNHMSKPSFSDWQNYKENPDYNLKPRQVELNPEMSGNLECHCHRLERGRGGYRLSGCSVQMEDGRGEARLFARNELPWPQWTLLELLKALAYSPNLIEYFKPQGTKPRLQTARVAHNEYVNKVAAVVNRINDLRDRLRCGWRDGEIDMKKGCGKPLSPNFSYRVFPAAYGITVFGGCTSTEPGRHDTDAYFNHCKRCLTIIDSRESSIRDDSGLNTYVCVHCGGWGQEAQGEFLKCGECGSYEYELDRNGKSVRCVICNHQWRPLDKYWNRI